MTLKRFLQKIKDLKNKNYVRGFVGKNTRILKGCMVDSMSKIGNECFINTNVTITKASIGNYCSIGSNVVIGPGEHNLSKCSTSDRFYDNTYEELTNRICVIGNDVWIGTHAIILRGVKIGNGAVIGANSVVTKNVSDFQIVAGVPAKHIDYRLNKNIQNILKKSQWWELDFKDAKRLLNNIENSCKEETK